MKLKIAQVIGLNTDQKAAQALSSVQDADNAFLAVIELVCDDAFTKGRQVLSELSDFYFDFEGTPAEKLTAAFGEAEKKLSGNDFHLVLGTVSGKILYLIGQGEVTVYLKRFGKLSPLLSVGAPTQLISGFLSEGDRLLLATSNLISFLAEDIDKALSLPIESFEEEISSRIGAQNLEDQGLAALALEVEREAEEVSIPSLPEDSEPTTEYPLEQTTLPQSVKSVFKTILRTLVSSFKRLREYFPKSGRGKLALAVILIIIILSGAGLKYKAVRDQQRKEQFNQLLSSAKDDFNGAKGLSTLNPQEAKNKLEAAKDKASKALVLKPNDQEVLDLKKQIEQDAATILQQFEASVFPLFLDMDLVKKNFRVQQISLSSGKLLLLDPTVKTLVVIDLAKKSNQILAGSEQLGEGSLASLNGGLAFVYSKDKGVLRVDTTNQKLAAISKKDSDWGQISDIYGFAGNVYLLDNIKNQIWKYLPTSEGYSDKREYLNKNTKVDLNGSLRMQIESSVYVLKNGGEILRFTRGDKDNFSIGGLDKGVKDPKSFFVSSDSDNLYVLDSGNSRLLILTKTGAYKGQITGEKFGLATDLVVDEKEKKVYLLEGSKIYTVDLK